MPAKRLPLPLLLGVLVLAAALPAAASAQSFAPLSGSAGCIIGESALDEDAAAKCTKVKALTDVIKIAVSPDDKHVYAASDTAIVTFSRAADTGALDVRELPQRQRRRRAPRVPKARARTATRSTACATSRSPRTASTSTRSRSTAMPWCGSRAMPPPARSPPPAA